MDSTPIHVRAAKVADLDELGVLAGGLVRLHHEFDPQRFMTFPDVERGYAHFFAGQLDDPQTVLVVAEQAGMCVGYAFARLEPRDWNALLDACGVLHDIYVGPGQRGGGIGSLLLEETIRRVTERGAPRLVLSTATQNVGAQHLFAKHGFRATMIEMTRELP